MYKSVCEMSPIEETPHHRAMLVTKSTELCRRRGLGTCPHSDISIKAKLAPSLSSLMANLLVLGHLLHHNLLALSHIPTTLQSAIVMRSDPTLELSRLPTLLVSLTVKSRRSSPCREPRERILTHGPKVPLLTRAAPLRSDTTIRASSRCAVRRPPLLQCTVLHLLTLKLPTPPVPTMLTTLLSSSLHRVQHQHQ
jgi:hypothetical protein